MTDAFQGAGRMTSYGGARPSGDGVPGEDAELVRRCREGDAEAFEHIYRRYGRTLYHLTYRMVGRLEDAQDLLQEIFLLAFDRLATYEGRAALGTWLHRLAVNRCLDFLKSRSTRDRSRTGSLEDAGQAVPLPPAPVNLVIDLERAMARLPHSYRAAFVLHDVEGLAHREVAEILGVAEGTSKSLVHKARVKLRSLLRPSVLGEPK